MYESIKGQLIDKTPSKAIVEAFGIGYRLMIPLSTYTQLPSLQVEVRLYLSQVVREDSNTLYAFLSKEERDLFEVLITISGIGPKTGIGIIGHVEMGAFERAISTSDIRLLSKLPGIGKKTAERLVIEMRDKFKVGSKGQMAPLTCKEGGLLGDATNALMNLGYNPLVAQNAVRKVLDGQPDEKNLGKIITDALKNAK